MLLIIATVFTCAAAFVLQLAGSILRKTYLSVFAAVALLELMLLQIINALGANIGDIVNLLSAALILELTFVLSYSAAKEYNEKHIS